jgi:O-antigen ligase
LIVNFVFLFSVLLIMYVSIKKPIVSYYALIFTLPFEAFQFGSVFFTPIKIFGILAVLSFLFYAIQTCKFDTLFAKNDIRIVLWLFFLFIGSVFYGGVVIESISMLFNFFSMLLIYFLTLYYLKQFDQIKFLFLVFSVSFALMTVLSLIEHLDIFSTSQALGISGDLRLGNSRFLGYLRNPNRYAFQALFALAGCFFLLKIYKGTIIKIYLILLTSIITFGVMISYSRTGIIAVILMTFLFLILNRQLKALFFTIFFAISLLFIISLMNINEIQVFDYQYALDRLNIDKAFSSGSMIARIDIFNTALENFYNSPLLGVGTGGLLDTYTLSGGLSANNTHNLALSLLSQYGLVGFTLFSILLIKIIIRHARIYSDFKSSDISNIKALNNIYISIFVAVIVHGLSHDILLRKWLYIMIAISPIILLVIQNLYRRTRL